MTKEREIKEKIRKGYLAVGYVLFGLILSVFGFIYQTMFTGKVALAIDVNHGRGWKSIVFFALLFVMMYLAYHFVLKDLEKS